MNAIGDIFSYNVISIYYIKKKKDGEKIFKNFFFIKVNKIIYF